MSLPSIDQIFSGGFANPYPNLSPNQSILYQAAERWLNQQRSNLGENAHIRMTRPRRSHLGVACNIENVVSASVDFMLLFKSFNPLCSEIRSVEDHENPGMRVYSVTISFPEGGENGKAFADQYVGSIFSVTRWSRYLDEPRILITLFILVTISAIFTTKGSQWKALAATAYALLPRASTKPPQ